VKRFFDLAIILAIPFVLAACGGSLSASGTGGAATAAQTVALARTSQLALGLIKLEGTANAMSTAQATELLPLWQAYASLLGSSTSAQAEYQGLQAQIESAITPDQLKAIEAMNLTEADLQSALQGHAGAGASAQGTPDAHSSSSSGVTSGAVQAADGGAGDVGGPPPGGDGGLAGGGFAGDGGAILGPEMAQGTASSNQSVMVQTQVASAGANSNIAGVDIQTVSLVVSFLETKVYGTPTPSPTMTPAP
jgi:hypothetical protein